MAAKESNQIPYDKIPRWSLHSWLTFLNERAPPLVYGLLAAGPSLSGLAFFEGHVGLEKFVWTFISQLVLMLMVRVMDDVKDFEKDKVVHPDRPLPRGLLRYEEVCTVINATLVLLFLYAGLMGLRFNWIVAGFYAFQVFYTFLMYIEFGAPWLEDWVLFYAFTHQISIYFGAFFVSSLAGVPWNTAGGFYLGSVAFSGFFTYEVCRKLDPTLPRLKGTYLIVYGRMITFLVVITTVTVGVISSYMLGFHWLLWPLEGLMILSVLVLFLLPVRSPKPKAHKPVEALSVIYLLIHMWAAYIASYF